MECFKEEPDFSVSCTTTLLLSRLLLDLSKYDKRSSAIGSLQQYLLIFKAQFS